MSDIALMAMQVRLALHNLESPAAFRRHVDSLAARAADAAGDAEHRLMVFPEAIGHFLPLAFAPLAVLEKSTVAEAMTALAVRRPLSVLRGLLDAGAPMSQNALQKGVMHALLPACDALMREVFAAVARRHRATVVAGSHLCVHRPGRVTNTSYTFDPNGRLVATTDKVNLVPGMEDAAPGGLALARGDAGGIPLVDTPAGSLATLICYDGFREPHTRGERWAKVGPRIDAAGADVIANPAANPWDWNGPWFFAEPGEEILRCDQWRTEGLPATLGELHHARYGITAHLCGQILDQRFEGVSEVLERRDGEVVVLARAKSRDQSEIVCARAAVDAERR